MTLSSEQRSQLHELKQAWKSARRRWLGCVLKIDLQSETAVERADAAWVEYEQARDDYFRVMRSAEGGR